MKPQHPIEYPIDQIIRKRWSPRAYSSQPVEQDKLYTVFEAARWAASARNQQPWLFFYAHKAETEKFNSILECLDDYNKVWAKDAPVLILTLAKQNFDNGNPNRWAMYDLGLAVGNMTVQANIMDLNVINLGAYSVDILKKSVRIPEGYEPAAILALGYLGEPEQLPEQQYQREIAVQVRKPFDELFMK